MRVITMDIPSQQTVTLDKVNVQAEAKVMFKVIDPIAATIKVLDHIRATAEVSKDAFHNILTRSERSELAYGDTVSRTLQRSIDQQIRKWGLEVTEVKIGKIHFGKN